MKNIYIKDWYGTTIVSTTYDEGTKQLSGVKVPTDVPGVFTFYFSDNTSVDVMLRYYVKGYAGAGATQELLHIDYPKGEVSYLPDLSSNFSIYVMTTNPSSNHVKFNVSGDFWWVCYNGSMQKIMISSGTNPTVRIVSSIDDVEGVLPLNNKYKVWGISNYSLTTPDIYADVLTAATFPSGTVLYTIFTNVVTDAIFLTLYKNDAPENLVNKTSQLVQVEELAGVLRKQCSVTSPVITIQHEGKPSGNYCYIPDFKRYYYIQDVVNIATDLWELYMKSDPLFSFRSEFLNSLVTVLRATSSSLYDRMLHDNLMPIQSSLTRTRTYSTNSPLTPGVANGNDDHILLSVFSNAAKQSDLPNPSTNIPTLGIKSLGYYYPKGCQIYSLNWHNMNELARIFACGGPKGYDAGFDTALSSIFGTDDLSPYIISLRAYPIKFSALMDNTHFKQYTSHLDPNNPVTNGVVEIPCGNIWLFRKIKNTSGGAEEDVVCLGRPVVPVNPTLDFGTITVPTPTSFIDTEPNAKAILHLPYIGDIDFNLSEYAGLTISILYYLDIFSGYVKAVIRNNADNKILFAQSGKMGVDIPMLLNNMQKGDNERIGQAIKLGTTVAATGAAAVGSVMASPMVGGLIGGGIGLLGNSVATPFFNTPAQNKQFAAGDITEFFTDQQVYLEIVKPTDNYTIFYAQQYGIPSKAIVNLSSYTGTGFVVVSPTSRITHPVEATLNEYEEICSALKSGVVI